MDSENIVQYFLKKIEWTRNRIEFFVIYQSSIAFFADSFYKIYNFDGNIKHDIFLPDFDIILWIVVFDFHRIKTISLFLNFIL